MSAPRAHGSIDSWVGTSADALLRRITVVVDWPVAQRDAALRTLAECATGLPDPPGPDAWRTLADCLACVAPEIRVAAARIRALLFSQTGAALLRGVGFPLVEAPLRHLLVLAVATLVGVPTCEGDPPKPLWPVRFIPGIDDEIRQRNVSVTMGPAELHTDSAGKDVPEDMFSLWCVHHARCGGGQTILVNGLDVLREMSLQPEGRHALDVLRERPIPVLASHDRVHWRRMIDDDADGVLVLRYRPTLFRLGMDVATGHDRSAVERALDAFARIAHEPAMSRVLPLESGEAIFVNNHQMLHGRRAFEDPRRLLLRVRARLETTE